LGYEINQFGKDEKNKQIAIEISKDIIKFLDGFKLKNFYIEPIVCFTNKNVSVANMVLSNEELFLEELVIKISKDPFRMNFTTFNKCATLLSEYSAESS